MHQQSERRILDWLKRLDRKKVGWSIGMVFDDSPFTVTIEGENIAGLSRLASYSPTTGDKVLIVRLGHDYVVVGELV